MLRHKVKPGITGLAQVNGCRGETDTLDKMRRRVEFDHEYIRGWSLWLDLRDSHAHCDGGLASDRSLLKPMMITVPQHGFACVR